MKEGTDVVRRHDLSSLWHLASVGEPLNAEAVIWSEQAFGKAESRRSLLEEVSITSGGLPILLPLTRAFRSPAFALRRRGNHVVDWLAGTTLRDRHCCRECPA
jgi:hypothetical protein